METIRPDAVIPGEQVITLPPEPTSVRFTAIRTSEGTFVIVSDETDSGMHMYRLPPERAERVAAALLKSAQSARLGLTIVEGNGGGV